MGTNAKLNMGFSRRLWREQGLNGETYSDTGYQNTWEVSRAQDVRDPGPVHRGDGRDHLRRRHPRRRWRSGFLAQAEPVIPGITRAWDGCATVDSWKDYRWTKGSYSYWKVGQYTAFSGAESEASGSIHFAGEHTSQDFQGYLNGAVDTGQRVAAEILAAVR